MSLLEVAGVTVRFGGITAVNDVSFAVEAGTITGMIGPNGAGKTTLFNVVTGLQHPTAGQVRWCGADISRRAPSERARAGIARTFQRLEVFGSLTAFENVLAAAELHRTWDRSVQDPESTADELIHRVGLTAYRDVLADALPTGVARLVELARALAQRPRLLLLDEPASGQSEEETRRFADLLREVVADGAAVLIVEHDIELVMGLCDTLHVLDFGELICSGSPAVVQADARVQHAYLGAFEAEPAR